MQLSYISHRLAFLYMPHPMHEAGNELHLLLLQCEMLEGIEVVCDTNMLEGMQSHFMKLTYQTLDNLHQISVWSIPFITASNMFFLYALGTPL